MALANLGSIATRVTSLVDNIPTSISGAELINLVYDQVIYAEQYTGLTIGSVGIAERFQPALVALSAGALQKYIEAQGADKTFSIGEFSVTKNSSSDSFGNTFTQDGMEKLKRIGRKMSVYKAYG